MLESVGLNEAFDLINVQAILALWDLVKQTICELNCKSIALHHQLGLVLVLFVVTCFTDLLSKSIILWPIDSCFQHLPEVFSFVS